MQGKTLAMLAPDQAPGRDCAGESLLRLACGICPSRLHSAPHYAIELRCGALAAEGK